MLTPEQQAYLSAHPRLEKLTSDPDCMALFKHPIFGAYTVAQCMDQEELAKAYYKRVAEARVRPSLKPIEVSNELYSRHERCIPENGFGMFEGW